MTRTLIVILVGALLSCAQKPTNKFSDNTFIRITEFQDHRLSDSLYQFFEDPNPAYRRDAVLAFASIQDTLAVEKIAKLLIDENADVRKAAVFALGQTGGSQAFRFLSNTPDNDTIAFDEIMEAAGKTMKKGSDSPVDINAWGLYRLALRGIADSLTVTKAVEFLNSPSENTRLGAAHFFARGPKDISLAEAKLQQIASNDASPYVRMAASSALRKITTPASLEVLKKIGVQDSDYRVRVNAVRALQSFPIKDTKQNLFDALSDSNQHVGVAAAEALKAVATKDEFLELVTRARATTNWRTKGNLFEASLNVSNSKSDCCTSQTRT